MISWLSTLKKTSVSCSTTYTERLAGPDEASHEPRGFCAKRFHPIIARSICAEVDHSLCISASIRCSNTVKNDRIRKQITPTDQRSMFLYFLHIFFSPICEYCRYTRRARQINPANHTPIYALRL